MFPITSFYLFPEKKMMDRLKRNDRHFSGLVPYERWSWDLSPAGSDSKLSVDPFSYLSLFIVI